MYYINFFPGSIDDEAGFSITKDPAYGLEDIVDLADSVIRGCTGSAPIDGAKAALEDGSIWGDLCATYGEDVVQGAIEELHEACSKEWNVTFITIPCPDDTMGDTSPSECEAYREWFTDQLAAEYPYAQIIVTSRPGGIEVGTSDDADEAPIIERLREFSNACWDRCKWDFLDAESDA